MKNLIDIKAEYLSFICDDKEIPEREKWLFENKEALQHVLQGLKDSFEGRTHYRGSFDQYADEEIG